jgi:hypothetical protein
MAERDGDERSDPRRAQDPAPGHIGPPVIMFAISTAALALRLAG